MRISLCTSPHLDRSPLFDGRSRRSKERPLRIAQTFLPMGLLSLAASVEDLASVRVVDLNKAINAGLLADDHPYCAAAELILADDPDLVGFMTECDSFHHLVRICACLKARRPRLVIALGCVHASYNAREILMRYDFIDFIIRGEGEVAFRQLVEAMRGMTPLTEVGNLTHRHQGSVRASGELPLIPDLDELPFVNPDLVGLEADDAVWVEIGRGCPFKCNFCVTAPYWHRRHRIKSPGRIIEELGIFRDRYGRRDFNFTHDLFTTDRRWVLRFCAAMEQADLEVTWTCSSRTDTLDEEQLAAMARAGCRDIYFGVETGTAGMQQAIDKGLGLPESRRIIELCHRYGVGSTVGFIAGLPGETPDSLAGTLREASAYLAMDRTVVHLFGYCPYRGSSAFADIESSLAPELRFVDFPVDSMVDVENRALVMAHRDVFARYSRPAAHVGHGFDWLLAVAEEYFPLLNAVPLLTGWLRENDVDPYRQLCAWADWLQARRGAGGPPPYDAHLGTIDDFLEFADDHARAAGIADERFADVLRWERAKQAFRSEAPGTALPPDGTEAGAGFMLNPTLRLEEFRLPPDCADPASDQVPASYAFLRRRNGEATIVRLGAAARAVLDMARNCDSAEQLRSVLAGTAPSSTARERRDESIDSTLEQLVANDMLFVAAS